DRGQFPARSQDRWPAPSLLQELQAQGTALHTKSAEIRKNRGSSSDALKPSPATLASPNAPTPRTPPSASAAACSAHSAPRYRHCAQWRSSATHARRTAAAFSPTIPYQLCDYLCDYRNRKTIRRQSRTLLGVTPTHPYRGCSNSETAARDMVP